MKLRSIDFGNVLGASGAQGFFGEGYWFHRLYGPFSPDLTGITFVAKTTTLFGRKGNAELTGRGTLRRLFPSCIKAKPWRGVMLNAVGLSNFGLGWQLGDGRLQQRTTPWVLSFMSLADTPARRLEESRIAVDMIGLARDDFRAPVGLQINLSCPNTEHDPLGLIKESARTLDIGSVLGVPQMPKFSIASAPIKAILGLNDHPACDAICVSNTLPAGWQGIDLKKVWGTKTSPLARYGGGGISGKPLLPLVCEWVARLRDAGFTKPINVGGGIMSPTDVLEVHKAGGSSIFLGTVVAFASFFPFVWNIGAIVAQANKLDWRQ